MAIYKLTYAEEHLAELFQEAHDGGEVFIVRRDGLSCQLMATANAADMNPVLESEVIAEPALGGDLVPA